MTTEHDRRDGTAGDVCDNYLDGDCGRSGHFVGGDGRWHHVFAESVYTGTVTVHDIAYHDGRFMLTGTLNDGTRVGLQAISDEDPGEQEDTQP